jgi:predicted DNA-binding transcriptional regulator AlpA
VHVVPSFNPPDFQRNKLLGTAETAEFLNISIPHLRRLVRERKVPQPIRVTARKLGWRTGELIDFVSGKAA